MSGHVSASGRRAVALVNDTAPYIRVAEGHGGFRGELDDLRKRMRRVGLSHDHMAAEVMRRYRLRPREAYRLAHGWTLDEAAARFNARAAELGTDPDGRAGLAGNRLCEYEKWPDSGRRPPDWVFVMLATVYQTAVWNLLDLDDHENLPPRVRFTLLHARPDGLTRSHAGATTWCRGWPACESLQTGVANPL